MTQRKTITINNDDGVYDRLLDAKRDDENWTDCLERLLDGAPPAFTVNADDALTTDDKADIVEQTARRAADEVESRLSRR